MRCAVEGCGELATVLVTGEPAATALLIPMCERCRGAAALAASVPIVARRLPERRRRACTA